MKNLENSMQDGKNASADIPVCMHAHTDRQTGRKPNATTVHPMGCWRHKNEKHKNPFTLERTVNLEATVLM